MVRRRSRAKADGGLALAGARGELDGGTADTGDVSPLETVLADGWLELFGSG